MGAHAHARGDRALRCVVGKRRHADRDRQTLPLPALPRLSADGARAASGAESDPLAVLPALRSAPRAA